MADSKASKRKTEPKGKKKKDKEVTSPRKKVSNRKSANIENLVAEENKSKIRTSVPSSGDILPYDSQTKKESEEDFRQFQEDLSKKVQAKREENEKKNKKSNGVKSPRKKEASEPKANRKIEEKEKEEKEKGESEREKTSKKLDLTESYSDTQDSLASILSSMDKEKELVIPRFLKKLTKLLNQPTFAEEFIRAEGYEKLSLLLVKLNDTESFLSILSFLQMTFRDFPGVFEQVFTKSSVMVTTLVWLLVKVKKSDLAVTAKVYSLLASLPSIAQSKNFPEIEIHNLIFSAFTLYYQKSKEKIRFQNLIKTLQTTSKELKLAVLNLINAVIEMYQSVEGRIGIRLEFNSLGFENIIKSSEETKPEILQEISRYEYLRDKDLEIYKKLHANLISPAWIEGKDLQTLAQTLTTRWASLPNQQSVVIATLCSLLHIPNDEIVGTTMWLFLNKVVNHVVSNVQEKLTLGCDNIDLKPVLHMIEVAEVNAKKELEEEKRKSQQQADRIRSLESRQISENSLNSVVDMLRISLSDSNSKLSDLEIKLSSETENANQLQIKYEELKNNFEILEKQDQENLNLIKSLQKKIEDQEKILQTKRNVTHGEDHTLTTPTSTIVAPEQTKVLPFQLTDHPSGIDLDKEELRMNRAMSKFGGNTTQTSSWIRNPVTPASPRTDQDGPLSPNGLNILSQKVPSRVTSPRMGDEIPEWKKKILEKERLDKEKMEREQQKKLENLSTTVGSSSGTLYGSSGSETSIGSPVISVSVQAPEVVTPEVEDFLLKPSSDLTLAEKEEIRLAKALNRPRGRTSQVHT